MEPVVLTERDNTGVLRSLSEAQVRVLRGSGLVKVDRIGSEWRIQQCGRVGAVRAGDLDVLVEPKVGIVRLLFFLGYAKDPRFRPDDVAAAPAPGLWPALAESLARQAERALSGGVLQGYAAVDDDLALIRGRIRFADQFARRPGVSLPMAVRFDDYTADIAENRLLRAAVRAMMAVPRLAPAARQRLARIDGRLADARPLRPRDPMPSWRPSRLNARYAPALRLAELVLDNHSAEPGFGDVAVASFAVNMEKVFEDFVTVAIGEALSAYPGEASAQHEARLDREDSILIKPDLVYLVDGRPAAIFDAKYKLEKNSGYVNADTYQMVAYCLALGVRTGWLVYAKGTGPPRTKTVRNSAIEIIHHPLDLTADPHEILHDIRTLAQRAAVT